MATATACTSCLAAAYASSSSIRYGPIWILPVCWLGESDVGGRLLCVGIVIHAGGERAIHADRATFMTAGCAGSATQNKLSRAAVSVAWRIEASADRIGYGRQADR